MLLLFHFVLHRSIVLQANFFYGNNQNLAQTWQRNILITRRSCACVVSISSTGVNEADYVCTYVLLYRTNLDGLAATRSRRPLEIFHHQPVLLAFKLP